MLCVHRHGDPYWACLRTKSDGGDDQEETSDRGQRDQAIGDWPSQSGQRQGTSRGDQDDQRCQENQVSDDVVDPMKSWHGGGCLIVVSKAPSASIHHAADTAQPALHTHRFGADTGGRMDHSSAPTPRGEAQVKKACGCWLAGPAVQRIWPDSRCRDLIMHAVDRDGTRARSY